MSYYWSEARRSRVEDQVPGTRVPPGYTPHTTVLMVPAACTPPCVQANRPSRHERLSPAEPSTGLGLRPLPVVVRWLDSSTTRPK